MRRSRDEPCAVVKFPISLDTPARIGNIRCIVGSRSSLRNLIMLDHWILLTSGDRAKLNNLTRSSQKLLLRMNRPGISGHIEAVTRVGGERRECQHGVKPVFLTGMPGQFMRPHNIVSGERFDSHDHGNRGTSSRPPRILSGR